MMDGQFSQDMTGSMALIPGAGGALPAVPFIRTPGLVARAADGAFAARGPRDLAVRMAASGPDADMGADMATRAGAAIGADMAGPMVEREMGVGGSQPDMPSGSLPGFTPDSVSGSIPSMQAVMPISAPANEAAIAEERAQARREVLDELAAAQAALGRDAQLLAAALARMAQPPAADVAALTAHLGQAVAHLAAARAGQAIDADAAPFIRRIRALAERITAGFADVTLCLHPDDMAAVQALLQGHCPPDLTELAQARLRPDPGLLRGDLRLQAKGVLLEDLITAMDRPATSEAKA